MKALIPFTFRTGAIVDEEAVNGNLRTLQRDIKRVADKRYTYSTLTFDLDGMANTDTAEARTIKIIHPGSIDAYFDVVGVELSIYATAGVTWTLTDVGGLATSLETLTVDTAGTSTEAYASSNRPTSAGDDQYVALRLSSSGASTIARGTLTLHLRTDRHKQNNTAVGTFSPTLVNATTSTAASVLNTNITTADTARDTNAANATDLRGFAVAITGLASTRELRLPGMRTKGSLQITGTLVAGVGESVDVSDGTNTLTLNGAGTSTIVEGTATLAAFPGDDPTDTGDDLVLTLTPAGGTIERATVFLWWS
jgi:hypothetical protein